MKKSIMAVLVLSLTLVSCGTNTKKDSDEGKTETDTTLSTAVDSEVTFPYTYTDAAGRDIVIEKEIQSIAVNYLPLWESLMLLGIQPIAATGVTQYVGKWKAFEGYDLTSVQDLGSKEVNLEKLAEINPDLMLIQAADINNLEISNYEKTTNVVVFDNRTRLDWRASLEEIGKLVGKPEKARQVISEINKTISDAKTKLDEKYKNQTVMQISVMGLDNYYMSYREDLYGESGLNLQVPEGFAKTSSFEQVSLEAIAQMNPDYLFVNVFEGDESVYEEIQKSSVWQNLDSVKNNRVYNVGGAGHSTSGLSTIYTINFIIDKLLSDK